MVLHGENNSQRERAFKCCCSTWSCSDPSVEPRLVGAAARRGRAWEASTCVAADGRAPTVRTYHGILGVEGSGSAPRSSSVQTSSTACWKRTTKT
jgi:2-polyprenyl-6-methoxyphenol hydroxylase-like FAD-dependent oxidoreductase